MSRTVIFDFDGTIADSLRLVIAVFHDVTDGKHKAQATDIDAFRSKSIPAVLHELGIRWWQVPSLLTRGRRVMHGRMSEVKPFPGIVAAVRQLHAEGYALSIVSSNSAANIRHFLHEHKLDEYFRDVQGSTGVFGKVTVLKRALAKQHLRAADCLYIGDEVRDVLAAQRVGMPMLAVAWGYNTRSILQEAKPDAIVESPSKLVGAVRTLRSE